jgi:hypothetical protein
MLGENTMTDLLTYFARFSAELAVALSGMAYDPMAWFSFIALLLSGGLGTFSLGRWWQKLSGLLLVVLYITLQRRYTGTAGVPTWGSHLAFVLICLVGFAVGREIGRRLAEWSGVNKGR